jgi:isocitrate dehydrogenase kinase/phosphatase
MVMAGVQPAELSAGVQAHPRPLCAVQADDRADEVIAQVPDRVPHDRAGRLIDAQEFRFLRFAQRARFDPELLEELIDGCR